MLYAIFTANISTRENTWTDIFADDTVITSLYSNSNAASEKLQQHLNVLETYLNQWRIKENNSNWSRIIFTTKNFACPQITPIPEKSDVKYLGLRLVQRLSWTAHMKAKQQQLNLNIKNVPDLLLKIHNCRLNANCYCTRQF